MKAAQISHYGHADQVKIVNADRPSVCEGKVLVEVKAASINPFDSKMREGMLGSSLKLPATLGGDISGVVAEVGQGVESIKPGDKVYGQAGVAGGASGAFAEFALTGEQQVGLMPQNLDFLQAAALPLTGLSALQVIQKHMQLQSGQKILIHGGAGGIGTVAIQMAKHFGAHVATTATGDGIDYVKSLGADEVIDYKNQRFDELLSDFDAVFDTVGGDTYQRSFKVLKKGGIIVSMLEQPNESLMQQYGVRAEYQQTRTNRADLDTLRGLVERGAVTVHVDATYPLDKVAEAFQAYESGSVKGKVVLQIA
ncbi:MAG TPA: NADP-dependent oxidoreductase [Candidatus Saccharimonadales bacterium]